MNDQEKLKDNFVPNDDKLEKAIKNFSAFHYIFFIFGICFICTTFIFNILLHPMRITGESMQPTINADFTNYNKHYDSLFYSKSNNYIHDDIVIVNVHNENIIKRVVAVAGDTINFECIPGTETYDSLENHLETVEIKITVNDKSGSTTLQKNFTDEPTIFRFITNDNSEILNKYEFYKQIDDNLKTHGSFSYTIPDNSVFCLGDNRNNSTDSRHYGSFDISQISGEVVLHIPYGKTIIYAIWHKIFG